MSYQRRCFSVIAAVIGLVVLSGCDVTPVAERVMPPVHNQQPMVSQSNKEALLTWHTGKCVPAIMQYRDYNNGIAGVLVSTIMTEVDKKQRRNAMEFKYGKAQQVVFMTSLRDALRQQQAYKKVKLTADVKRLKPNQVLIDVDFKHTRVLSAEGAYPITMNVVLTQTDHYGRKKRKNIIVKQDNSFWHNLWGGSFVGAQTSASELLMKSVMRDLDRWNEKHGTVG